MVSIDIHVGLEAILGVGALDRLTDDSYALAITGKMPADEVAKLPKDEKRSECVSAFLELRDSGIVSHLDYALAPSNPLRFVSSWKIVNPETAKEEFLKAGLLIL